MTGKDILKKNIISLIMTIEIVEITEVDTIESKTHIPDQDMTTGTITGMIPDMRIDLLRSPKESKSQCVLASPRTS